MYTISLNLQNVTITVPSFKLFVCLFFFIAYSILPECSFSNLDSATIASFQKNNFGGNVTDKI